MRAKWPFLTGQNPHIAEEGAILADNSPSAKAKLFMRFSITVKLCIAGFAPQRPADIGHDLHVRIHSGEISAKFFSPGA